MQEKEPMESLWQKREQWRVLYDARRFEEALQLFEPLLAESREASDHARVGMTLSALSRWDEAMARFTSALEYDPNNPFALFYAVAPLLVRGEWERAKETMERAFQSAYFNRWKEKARVEIAIALAKAGQVERALFVFEEALSTARSLEDAYHRSEALCNIAVALRNVGQVERAVLLFEDSVSAARCVENAEVQSDVLLRIALALVKVAEIERALAVLDDSLLASRRAGYTWFRCREYQWHQSDDIGITDAAVIFAKGGRLDEALAAAHSLKYKWSRSRTLSHIAVALVSVGQLEKASFVFEKALAAAYRIERTRYRSDALSNIAIDLANTGQVERALSILDDSLPLARRVKKTNYRIHALCGVAIGLATAGQVERAASILDDSLLVARRVKDAYYRIGVLVRIAIVLADMGRFEEALAVTRSVDGEKMNSRNYSLHYIVSALINAGKIEQALSVLEAWLPDVHRMERAYQRSEALQSIAVALVNVGQKERALSVLDDLLSTARLVEGAGYRYSAQGYIVSVLLALASAGHFEEPLAEVYRLEDAQCRSNALRGIALALAKKERFDEALALLSEIDPQTGELLYVRDTAVLCRALLERAKASLAWEPPIPDLVEIYGEYGLLHELQYGVGKAIPLFLEREALAPVDHKLWLKTWKSASGEHKTFEEALDFWETKLLKESSLSE